MNIRAIIIEDEEPARNLLKNYLNDHTDISLIGEFDNGFSGLKGINDLKPDLIFLDIQMPKLTGFELLEMIENPPQIIFTTAYDSFAIKAFEANATDYLLKPYTRERFSQSVEKAIAQHTNSKAKTTSVNSLLQTVENNPEMLSRIAVKSGPRVHVIAVDEIVYFEADGDYVKIHTKQNDHLKEKPMKYYETHLDPLQFIRIHRSYIVNVNEILKIEYYDKETHVVILKNNEQLRASTNGYKLLKQMLNL
jgi:two-component system, LytTR family, response regulator